MRGLNKPAQKASAEAESTQRTLPPPVRTTAARRANGACTTTRREMANSAAPANQAARARPTVDPMARTRPTLATKIRSQNAGWQQIAEPPPPIQIIASQAPGAADADGLTGHQVELQRHSGRRRQTAPGSGRPAPRFAT